MKSIKHIQKCFSPLFNLLCFIVFLSFSVISCGGGGGGAAGASIPADQYSTHNPGGWGGDGYSGGGSGGSNGGTGVNTTGFTPLVVDRYVYNGTTYDASQRDEMIAVIRDDTNRPAGTPFEIDFYVSGETRPRKVRVTKTSRGIEKFEHQYQAIYYVTGPNSVDATELWYYANDGFDISADTGSNVDGWRDSNGGYHRGGIIRGVQGDITLTQVLKGTDFTIQPTAPDTASEVGTGIYKLANTSDGISFAATPSVSGATYTWTFNNGAPVSGTNSSISATPDSLALTVSRRRSSATPINVHCVVTKEGTTTKESYTTIMVYMPYDLPSFEIADDMSTPISNGTIYRLDNMSSTVVFGTFSAGPMPAGMEYEWYRNNIRIPNLSSDRVELTAADMGFSADSIGKTEDTASEVTIKCIAKNPDAETASTNQTFVEQSVTVKVWLLSIPEVTVNVQAPSSVTPETAIIGGQSTTVYKINSMSGIFTITASGQGGASFPSGSSYVWTVSKVNGGTLGPVETTSPTFTIDLSDATLATALGITEDLISWGSGASSDTINVVCTVKHTLLPENEWKTNHPTKTIRIYRPLFPDNFEIGISDNGDLPSRTVGANTIYTIRQSDIDNNHGIIFTATPATGISFREGTTFEWSVESVDLTTLQLRTINPTFTTMGITSAPTSQVEYQVKCKAHYGSDESTLVTESLYLAPPIKLTTTHLRLFGQSISTQINGNGSNGYSKLTVINHTSADDSTVYFNFYNNSNTEIPEDAQATFHWYIGSSNTKSVATMSQNVEEVYSVDWTDDQTGEYNMTVADFKNLVNGKNTYVMFFLKVVPANPNYEESDLTPYANSYPFVHDINYTTTP